uniref:Uncharacterized protein n=1 Tax=Physcomitrium patens TaxID=3218 RepID=A0A7I4DZ69_PHYPA
MREPLVTHAGGLENHHLSVKNAHAAIGRGLSAQRVRQLELEGAPSVQPGTASWVECSAVPTQRFPRSPTCVIKMQGRVCEVALLDHQGTQVLFYPGYSTTNRSFRDSSS